VNIKHIATHSFKELDTILISKSLTFGGRYSLEKNKHLMFVLKENITQKQHKQTDITKSQIRK